MVSSPVMAVSASLRALLNQAIDYAGMFPPCALALEPALRNQASYVRSSEVWMLNGFVLPVGQFDAATKFASKFDSSHPLRVAALGPKTTSVESFRDALENAYGFDVAERKCCARRRTVAAPRLRIGGRIQPRLQALYWRLARRGPKRQRHRYAPPWTGILAAAPRSSPIQKLTLPVSYYSALGFDAQNLIFSNAA